MPSSGSVHALWDDKLSGYPQLDNFPDQWAYGTVFYDTDTNGCWRKSQYADWCGNPVLDSVLGLCKNHLDELRETNK